MKKYIIIVVIVVSMFVMTGCGDTPAAAVEATPSTMSTVDYEPTSTPSPSPIITPESQISEPAKKVGFVKMRDFDLPKEDEQYFDRLVETHIEPFLNGFAVSEKYIDATGDEKGGYDEYKVVLVCENGSAKFTITLFPQTRMSRDVNKIADDIKYVSIIKEIRGEVVSEQKAVVGLANNIR